MTQKEQTVLMTCLSSLLPYGVLHKVSDGRTLFLDGLVRCSEKEPARSFALASEYNVTWTYTSRFELCDIKPYLRSLSSMTEKEKEEYKQFLEDIDGYVYSIDCILRLTR